MEIKWKPLIYNDIDLRDRLLISNDGQLFSLKSNKILKQCINKKGYYTTLVHIGSRNKYILIRTHRAVACMFVPGYKRELFVNHKDGNKTNNNYTNLEWVTSKENTQHALKNGLLKYCIPIKCDQTGQVFNNIREAAKWCGLQPKGSSINDYLLHPEKRHSAGRHPITNQKLTWSYV